MAGDPLAGNVAEARDKARRLIELQPWLNDPDWMAGRIAHDPHRGSSSSYLGIVLCLLVVVGTIAAALAYDTWQPLVVTVVFLVPGSALLFFRLKARHGRSECLLRTIPGRIGGHFAADVAVRLRAKPGAEVKASLVALSTSERRLEEKWRAEQRIGREEIRIGADGTWTIPVRIPIPSTLRAVRGLHPVCHIDEFNPLWRLEVRAETVGPDYSCQFEVPVFDLADLPYDEDKGRRGHRPVAFPRLSDFLGPDTGVGLLVGAILGFAVGFAYGGQVRYEHYKGLFMLPFLGALFTFATIGTWRSTVGAALRNRDLPDSSPEARLRVWLLTLIPWAVAAVVLGLAWAFLPFGGLVWGIGMLLCARSQPFGGFWRDPVFQSGAALVAFSLLISFPRGA